jgi:antitoxin ParD1/3/4
MNVSLTPELEQFVAGKVESGRYTSASEVVREALRLLEEHDRAKLSSLDPGGFVDPEATRARLLQRSRERRNLRA